MATFLYFTAIFFFLLLCALLCFVILIQEGKGDSGGMVPLGGGDLSGSMFGTSTSDVLKKATGWMVCIFFASCLILSYWTSYMGRSPTVHPSSIESITDN